MKKKYRIEKSDEFQAIIKHRKFINAKNYVIYTKDKEETHARIGIAVSKKIGNAVTRNKIKRQIREMIRPIYKESFSKDFIIIVKKPYLTQGFAENKKDLEILLKKVKI